MFLLLFLLFFQPDLEEDKQMKQLSDIEKDMEKNEKRLSEITYELDGIHRVSFCSYMDCNIYCSQIFQEFKQIMILLSFLIFNVFG